MPGLVSVSASPSLLEIGASLKAERERQRLTLGELSRRSGLGQTLISSIERGMRVRQFDAYVDISLAISVEPLTTLAAVAAALGQDTQVVVDGLRSSTRACIRPMENAR